LMFSLVFMMITSFERSVVISLLLGILYHTICHRTITHVG